MPQDHRGRWVGNPYTPHGGHRSLPRLQRLLSQVYDLNETESNNLIKAHRESSQVNPGGLRDADLYDNETYDLSTPWDGGSSIVGKTGTNSSAKALGDAVRDRSSWELNY